MWMPRSAPELAGAGAAELDIHRLAGCRVTAVVDPPKSLARGACVSFLQVWPQIFRLRSVQRPDCGSDMLTRSSCMVLGEAMMDAPVQCRVDDGSLQLLIAKVAGEARFTLWDRCCKASALIVS